MRPCLTLLLTLIFAVAAGAAAAQAPAPSRLSFETTYMPSDGDAGEGMDFVSASALYLDGKFSVWYLLGEPVINCTARWKNPDQASMEIDPLGDGSRLIEPAQQNEIEIYNLLLAASGPDPRDTKYGNGSAKTIAVLCDAGIVAQNGRDGFNVAGSPSWDRFLCALPDAGVGFQGAYSANKDACRAMNGEWLSAADAKEIARGGLKLSDVTALKASLNGVAVMKRAEKRAWREKSAAFKRARTAAYLEAIAGENGDEWDAHYNRLDVQNSLPDLPERNPSAEELNAYETAWQAIIAAKAPDSAFTKEWRDKEKTLVGGQLKRMKSLDKAAAREAEKYDSYVAALSSKKKNEPVEPDPMAAYRTDAPLTPYSEGEGRNQTCGLKRPDGSVAIPGIYRRPYYGGCPVQAVAGYDIYKVALEESHPVFAQGGLLSSDPICTYESGCGIYYDRAGNVLHKVGMEIYPRTESSNLAFSYGVIVANREWGGMYAYSLLSKKVLLEPSTKVFPTRTGWSREYVSATAILRNGRPALRLSISSNNSEDHGCGFGNRAYAYLFIDSEKVEEVGVCTDPDGDPMNQKIE